MKLIPAIPLTLMLSLMLFISGQVMAQPQDIDGLIIKPSAYSVPETLDRLAQILENKGLTIFTRVYHTKGAEKVGLSMAETELLIFGNPKTGTLLMQSSPTAAIDLPLKAVAWKDTDGQVWLAYNSPDYIAKRHGIRDRDELLKKISGALDKFTDYATKITKPVEQ